MCIKQLEWFGGVLLLLFLSACQTTQPVVSGPPEETFETGKQLLEEERFEDAVRHFQHLIQQSGLHEWTDEARFYLAEAYMQQEAYLQAADTYSEFIDLYPNHPRTPEASFQRAFAYYKLSPSYQYWQRYTEDAIRYFELFITEYPDHSLADRAGQLLQQLRSKMAHHEFSAARLYQRLAGYRNLPYYEAAVRTFQRTWERYPETRWADDALLAAIETYLAYSEQAVADRQEELLHEAENVYQKLLQLYPKSPLLKQAEALYQTIQKQLG